MPRPSDHIDTSALPSWSTHPLSLERSFFATPQPARLRQPALVQIDLAHCLLPCGERSGVVYPEAAARHDTTRHDAEAQRPGGHQDAGLRILSPFH
jgi:hypothetical protein